MLSDRRAWLSFVTLTAIAGILIYGISGDVFKWAGVVVVTGIIIYLYINLFVVFCTDWAIRQRWTAAQETTNTLSGLQRLFSGGERIFLLFGLYFAICLYFTLEYVGIAKLHDPLFCVTSQAPVESDWDALYYSFITPLTYGGEFVPRGFLARLATILQLTFGPIFIVMLFLQLRSAVGQASSQVAN
jgi:hypothetical protein